MLCTMHKMSLMDTWKWKVWVEFNSNMQMELIYVVDIMTKNTLLQQQTNHI